jgi:large subunit ribosomal protein L27e
VLSGRYAGRKAVVVKATDEGNADKRFGHCLVAGIDRYPRKIVKAMSQKKKDKRTKIKPFLKVLNYNHIMPTRYSVDFDLKKQVEETGTDASKIKETRKGVKKLFEERYKTQTSGKTDRKAQGAGYFFQKLRF